MHLVSFSEARGCGATAWAIIAVARFTGSNESFFQRSSGLRPRLYAAACFAGSEHSSPIPEVDQGGCNEDAEQRQRQQKLPAKTHQLIKTKARQGPAQPDVNKKKDANLEQKSERAYQAKKK
jgi:hypothetical protein